MPYVCGVPYAGGLPYVGSPPYVGTGGCELAGNPELSTGSDLGCCLTAEECISTQYRSGGEFVPATSPALPAGLDLIRLTEEGGINLPYRREGEFGLGAYRCSQRDVIFDSNCQRKEAAVCHPWIPGD